MGSFLISIVVVVVYSIFDLTSNQKMALRHIRLTRRAANTVTTSMRYFMIKKRFTLLKEGGLP